MVEDGGATNDRGAVFSERVKEEEEHGGGGTMGDKRC